MNFFSFVKIGFTPIKSPNSSRKSMKKNVSRIRKKTFYLQFCMGTPEGNEFAG
jgi:hypothetical protein